METSANTTPTQQQPLTTSQTLKSERIPVGLDPLSLIQTQPQKTTPSLSQSTIADSQSTSQSNTSPSVQDVNRTPPLSQTYNMIKHNSIQNLQNQPQMKEHQPIVKTHPNDESYMDQFKQAQQVKDMEMTHQLEVGEVIVSCFERIKETLRNSEGKLYITNYRVLYKEQQAQENQKLSELYDFNSIPVGYVSKFKFRDDKKSNWLDLITKDDREFKFRFESAIQYQKAIDAMSRHCQLTKHRELFTHYFSNALKRSIQDGSIKDGGKQWSFIDDTEVQSIVMNEFKRMGVEQEKSKFRKLLLSDRQRIRSRIDLPSEVYIPKELLDDQILGCANVRINGRFPVLTFYKRIKLNGYYNSIALWRSAEPDTSIMGKRSLDDESFIQQINAQSAVTSQVRKRLFIFNHNEKDTKGCAFEQPNLYVNSKVINYGFADMKKLSHAFEKMWQASNNFQESKKKFKFLTKMDKAKWFSLMDNMISMAFLIEKALLEIHNGDTRAQNILIYCQNGQYGSTCLVSLAQVIIDPYYRTFEGFKALIMKDWVYFGHNFVKCHNLTNDSTNESYYAPMLVFFLDCVHQLIEMNNTQFEFTSEYLVQLGFQAFTNKYFEFTHLNPLAQFQQYENIREQLAGDQKQQQMSEKHQLVSIFSNQDTVQSQYRNRMYICPSSNKEIFVNNHLYYQSNLLKYWKGYFARYQPAILRPEGYHPSDALTGSAINAYIGEQFYLQQQSKAFFSIREDNLKIIKDLKINFDRINALNKDELGEILTEEDRELIQRIEQVLKV